MIRLFTSDVSMQSILESQYYLSSKANISLSDSNSLPEWERVFMVNQLLKELDQKKKSYQ